MGFLRSLKAAGCAALLSANAVQGIQVTWTSTDSIKSAAATIAHGMMTYYNGNQTGGVPGNLPAPYYWWEVGGMFGCMIDYWYYTGDNSYNDVVMDGMLFQVGPDNDYMPPNQTKTEGNDDQAFWGMAAMTAAEVGYPNPPQNQPQWLALAQAVFNSQAQRWDLTSCNGGLRWQIFTFNNGYTYKNTISNGGFFNIASRLARYTGNQTYADWADKAWDWVTAVGLVDGEYNFWDGTDDTANCTAANHILWAYNAGVFALGAATMWNITSDTNQYNVTSKRSAQDWQAITTGIVNGLGKFFPENGILSEYTCENLGNCDTDNKSFKAYVMRWLAATTKLAPFTIDMLQNNLTSSARGAAQACSGGNDGATCGLKWNTGQYDGSTGVGEQMSAMEGVMTPLIANVNGPFTQKTGGTSKGDPNAGSGPTNEPSGITGPITTGDKAGAGILTVFILVSILGGAWWMVV